LSLKGGDLKAAREYFAQSLNLREQLAHQDPGSAQARRDLAVSYSCLGNVSLQVGDLKASREYFAQALNLTEQLATRTRKTSRPVTTSRSLIALWAT